MQWRTPSYFRSLVGPQADSYLLKKLLDRHLNHLGSNIHPGMGVKMRMFTAACISILPYGCETWVRTTQQGKKLDVYTRTCYRIMLGLRQSETHTTNEELYQLAGARPITSIVRERQLQFTGHCLRMKSDEPANIYAPYTSSIAPVHRRGPPRRTLNFLLLRSQNTHRTNRDGSNQFSRLTSPVDDDDDEWE